MSKKDNRRKLLKALRQSREVDWSVEPVYHPDRYSEINEEYSRNLMAEIEQEMAKDEIKIRDRLEGDAEALQAREKENPSRSATVLLREIKAAGYSSDRRDGGNTRGEKQRIEKRARIEKCNRIASEVWAEASKARRYRYNKVANFAVPIRNALRREWIREGNTGDPDWLPTDTWIRDNITHPRKIRSS